MWGVVSNRIIKNDGDLVGIVNRNPLLDTSKYELQYLDGFMEAMNENQTADKMLSQLESEGDRLLLIKETTDHYKDASTINKLMLS